jgi:hypothetical protein
VHIFERIPSPSKSLDTNSRSTITICSTSHIQIRMLSILRIEKKNNFETKGEAFVCDLLHDSSYHLTLYIVYNFFVIDCNLIKITDRSTYLRNMSVLFLATLN